MGSKTIKQSKRVIAMKFRVVVHLKRESELVYFEGRELTHTGDIFGDFFFIKLHGGFMDVYVFIFYTCVHYTLLYIKYYKYFKKLKLLKNGYWGGREKNL